MKNKVMGRAALGFGLAWVLTIGATSFTLQGCANDPAAENEAKTGSIDLALSGTSPSGNLYRLRDAQIVISGASNTSVSTEDHLDQTQISLELLAGGYIADLLDGWRLERSLDGGMSFEDVPAILTSTDPLPFTVVDQQTTDVRLVFRAGDDVVELGNGRVILGIDVIDDQGPPPGGCEDACAIAEGMGCALSDYCLPICSDLTSIIGDPACAPFAEQYMDCAESEPGETYVCWEPDGYPIAGACQPLFDELIACLNPPCDADFDMDGWCVNQGDCNDGDPNVNPGVGDACEDGIDQNCDGVDPMCPPPPPPNWTCNPGFFGTSDGCDCGCGEFDPDCGGDVTVGACQFCGDPGSCSEGVDCPGLIDPNNNASCL